MRVHAGGEGRLDVLGKRVGGHGDDRDVRRLLMRAGAHRARGLVAVHHGHLNVHQDHVEVARLRILERLEQLPPVLANGALRALDVEQLRENLRVERVVLGAQEPHALKRGHAPPAGGAPALRGPGCTRSLGPRARNLHVEHDHEAASLALLARDADGAAHQLDQALGDRHPQARALNLVRERAFLARERVEQLALEILVHADAVVLHHEAELRVRLRACRVLLDDEPDASARLRVLDGVGQQVARDLHQADAIAAHPLMSDVLRDQLERLPLCLGLGTEHVLGVAREIDQGEIRVVERRLPRFDLVHVQDLVEDFQKGMGGNLHLVHVLAHPALVGGVVLDKRGQADNCV